jgi:hypothetical protein
MKLKCQHVSASEAGDEIFQVCFEVKQDQEDGRYVLISRAFLEEEEGEASPYYVETHDERLTGHYPSVEAELTRNRLVLRLPSPLNNMIEVEFTTSDRNFRKVQQTLGIILQEDMEEEE